MENASNGNLFQSEEKDRATLRLTPEELLKKFSVYALAGISVYDFEEILKVLKKYDYYYTLEYYLDYILTNLSDNDTRISSLSEKNGVDLINTTYWFIIHMFENELDKVTQEVCSCSNADIVVDGSGIFSFICFDRKPSEELQDLIYRIPLSKKKSLSKLSKRVILEDLKLRLYTTVEERGLKINEFNSEEN